MMNFEALQNEGSALRRDLDRLSSMSLDPKGAKFFVIHRTCATQIDPAAMLRSLDKMAAVTESPFYSFTRADIDSGTMGVILHTLDIQRQPCLEPHPERVSYVRNEIEPPADDQLVTRCAAPSGADSSLHTFRNLAIAVGDEWITIAVNEDYLRRGMAEGAVALIERIDLDIRALEGRPDTESVAVHRGMLEFTRSMAEGLICAAGGSITPAAVRENWLSWPW